MGANLWLIYQVNILLSEFINPAEFLMEVHRERERESKELECVGHRKAGMVCVWVGQILFQNHLFSFPPAFVLKTGKLLALEKVSFPYLLRDGPSRHHLASPLSSSGAPVNSWHSCHKGPMMWARRGPP